jgi:D-alanyl-D-alanine carboxypeptidase (penicillin-binding protein 5/6)
MRFKYPLLSLLCLWGISHSSLAEEDLDSPPVVTAGAWGIADAESKELLWALHPDEPRKAASTTKIMCAWVILEMAQETPAILDEWVSISKLAAGTAGSTAEVEEGEQVKVRDALYGLLLPSGNDMGNALAEHFHPRLPPPGEETPESAKTPASRTRMNFVAEMNRLAQHLGLKSTRYFISYGDGGTAEDRTTTVRDLISLAHAVQNHPLFREIASCQSYTARLRRPDGSDREVVWENTNKLLKVGNYDGVKTGSTPSAGRCLVASGSYQGKKLIVVTLGSSSDESRFADSRNLFRWAWGQLK